MPFPRPPGHGPHGPHGPHPRPGHPGFLVPRDEYDVVGLRELLRSWRPPTSTADLADLADRMDTDPEIGRYLRDECADLPPDFALEDVAVHQRKATFRRAQQLKQHAQAGEVVFIPPVPRHISEALLGCEQVTMIEAGHEMPPHLRHETRAPRIADAYSARARLESADIVVFDGFLSGGLLHVRRAVAGFLDERLLKPAAHLFAHFRGRPFPEDVPLPPDLSARINRL